MSLGFTINLGFNLEAADDAADDVDTDDASAADNADEASAPPPATASADGTDLAADPSRPSL